HMHHGLQPEHGQKAAHRQHHEHIVAIHQPVIAAQQDVPEQGDNDEHEYQAHFLAGDRKYKIGMGIRQALLDAALPRACAEHAAVLECLYGFLHLESIAAGRVEKTVDAAAHMIEAEIGHDHAADTGK